VQARLVKIKYITIRAEKVASPVAALHAEHLSQIIDKRERWRIGLSGIMLYTPCLRRNCANFFVRALSNFHQFW